MKHGTVVAGELHLACHFCGDSGNNTHLRVNLASGLYNCFRCNARGKLPPKILIGFYGSDAFSFSQGKQKDFPELIPGPATQRKSALQRYRTPEGDDAFLCWSPQGEEIGFYVRSTEKRIYGLGGCNWKSAPLPYLSSPSEPLRLVEGPYDARSGQDIVMFGLLPSRIKDYLRGHFYVWCPDGDLWTKPNLYKILISKLKYLIKDPGFLGLEVLPRGFDPDEASGQFVGREEVKKLWQ